MGRASSTQQHEFLKPGTTIGQPEPSGPYLTYSEEPQELEVRILRGVFFGLLFEALAAGVIVLIWWVR
jgi:hypothetical protein